MDDDRCPVCSVCWDRLHGDDAELRPRVLLCGHTFCTRCTGKSGLSRVFCVEQTVNSRCAAGKLLLTKFHFGVQVSQACSQCCRYLGYCVKDGQVCLIRLQYEQTLAAAVRGMWDCSSLRPMQQHLLYGYCAKQTRAATK